MAKKTAIDRAIETLEQQRSELLSKANIEAAALDASIKALRAQKSLHRSRSRRAKSDAGEQA